MYRFLLLFFLLLAGCSTLPTPSERLQTVHDLVAGRGWQSSELQAANFALYSAFPAFSGRDGAGSSGDVLTVYIEGDGLAWETRYRPSGNPTPVDPQALKMALQHPGDNVAYLARPCQYVELTASDNCLQRYWTNERFAPQIVDATDQALSSLKEHFAARSLRLVGYSGGGAVAALVAARRNDVVQLITVAGNMDHRAWTEHHRLSPLEGSLNPAEEWQPLAKVPQVHLLGGDDKIIVENVLDSYLAKFPEGRRPQKMVVPGYSHSCCWSDGWRALYLRFAH